MKEKIYRVSVVMDPTYGKKLIELSKKNHVWACNSNDNRVVAESINRGTKELTIESGVTTFSLSEGISDEMILLGILQDVELHHGEYSHDPPWNEIEVIGTNPTERIIAQLKGYGTITVTETNRGFIAKKANAC